MEQLVVTSKELRVGDRVLINNTWRQVTQVGEDSMIVDRRTRISFNRDPGLDLDYWSVYRGA